MKKLFLKVFRAIFPRQITIRDLHQESENDDPWKLIHEIAAKNQAKQLAEKNETKD